MKLVVWGLGFRGKKLVDCLGDQYVAAIIDSDTDKIGQEYKKIKVISLDKYMEDYRTLPIIITPAYQIKTEISQQLMDQNIFHFVFSSELPSNIHYSSKLGLDCYFDIIKTSTLIYLYGVNAFSIILYFMLEKYS